MVPVFGIDDSMDKVSTGIETIKEFIQAVNFVVPLPTIAAIIVADMAVRFSQLTLFCINWVLRRIADIIP